MKTETKHTLSRHTDCPECLAIYSKAWLLPEVEEVLREITTLPGFECDEPYGQHVQQLLAKLTEKGE